MPLAHLVTTGDVIYTAKGGYTKASTTFLMEFYNGLPVNFVEVLWFRSPHARGTFWKIYYSLL